MPSPSERRSWLDRPLATWLPLTWEQALWILLFAAAVATRFYDLGARAMSHDENLHTFYSWLLSRGQGYVHNPMMHGTLQMHLLALSYFLFGASDVTARLPAALFGIAAVVGLWWFRRWLGKTGALAAALMMTLSPYMLYYSRYARNEAFVVVWGLLMFVAIARYFETRQPRWLYLLAAVTALHYTTKETAYIYVALAMLYLGLHFLLSLLRAEWQKESARRRFGLLSSAGAALVLAALWMIVLNQKGFAGVKGETAVPANPNAPRAAAAAVSSLSPLLLWGAALAVLAIFAFLAALWLARRSFGDSFRARFPSLDLLIILGTFVLPQLAAFPVRAMGWDALDYSLQGLSHMAVFAVPLMLLSIVIGLAWDRRLWLTSAAIFYGLFTLFFTTFFTNGNGFFTGFYGSLAYWLEQQGVNRGGQPWYYYLLIQLPVYEFLPALASLLAGALGLAGLQRGGSGESGGSPTPEAGRAGRDADAPSDAGVLEKPWPAFNMPALLGFWALGATLAYTVAGEKMPWLTVHITLPMILLGGWAIGRVITALDWQVLFASRRWLGLLLVPVALVGWFAAIGAVLGTHPPFQGSTLQELQATTTFLSALLFALASTAILVRLWSGGTVGEWSRLLVLEVAAVLALLTARAGWIASYQNRGNGLEFIDYAHSADGVKTVMNQVEELSRRTADGLGIQVGYDNLVSWSFTWYLRDYPNQHYFGDQPTRELVDMPVVIVGQGNWAKIDPLLSHTHDYFEYVRMSWPMQEYFGLTWERVRNALSSPGYRKALWDIWFWRDYTEYGKQSGVSYDLAQWPVSERMRLYVRKDIAAKVWQYGTQPVAQAAVDPYAKAHLDLSATTIIGSPGSDPGQLQKPRNLAIAPDGSIYVVDTGNNRVQHFDATGRWLGAWGTFADGSRAPAPGGTFNEPWGIAVGLDGKVYVADTWNYRIQEFAPDGTFVRSWGQFGQASVPQGLYGPRSVAIDSKGRVFVADTGNKRIMVFGSEGNYLAQVGGPGFDNGQFDEPVGIAVNAQGELVVADTWNQRIQVFREQSEGNFVFERQWSISAWNGKSLDNKPYLAVSSDGRVWVTDPEGFRVLAFDANGNFLYSWGDFGTEPDHFQLPVGIAVDSSGGLWVADADGGRLMRFAPPAAQ